MKIFCINLKRRKDRWQKISRILKIANIKTERFEAIEDIKFPHYWCTLSHRKIIEIASKEKYPHVVVFEDDMNLYEKKMFLEKLDTCISSLPPDWHILYLGYSHSRHLTLERINPYIYKINNVLWTWSIVYGQNCYAELLRKIPKNRRSQESSTFIDGYKTIDEFLAKNYQKKYPCFITANLMAYHDVSFSDIENRKRPAKDNRIIFNLYKNKYIRIVLIMIGILWDRLFLSDRHRYQKYINNDKNKV